MLGAERLVTAGWATALFTVRIDGHRCRRWRRAPPYGWAPADAAALVRRRQRASATMNGGWPYPRWDRPPRRRQAGAGNTSWRRSGRGARAWLPAFECDVKLSADGVPFLLHDARWNAPPTVIGAAGAERCTWAANCRSWTPAAGTARPYAGEPPPSLAQFAALRANGLAEHRDRPRPAPRRRTGAVVVGRVLVAGRSSGPQAPRCPAFSFQPEALRAATAAEPLPRGLLLDTLTTSWHLRLPRRLITDHRLMDPSHAWRPSMARA